MQNANRSRHPRRHRHGGPAFCQVPAGPPWFDLKWLGASDRSAGKKYRDATTWHLAGGTPETVAGLTVDECKPGNAPRLLFSAMDACVATEIERAFAQAGHVVVSNSRNHRMERDVPLLVPEINPDHLKLVPVQQRSARLERPDRHQPELLHRGPDHGPRRR